MGGHYRERTEAVARFRDEIAPVPGHARRHVHTLETKLAKQVSTRSADDNILDVMALPRWPSPQSLDHGAWTVVPRMFTMSQLHLNEQTSTETTHWSHQCQLRTHAPQQHACYSITSSARASSVGGTVRPSALAVTRLMTSSNLVDC